jgi:hypothetical protein
LYLGAMITGMGIFIGCGYGSEMGIGVSTLNERIMSEDQSSVCPNIISIAGRILGPCLISDLLQ